MSKKYEHKIKTLKEHKQDKKHKHHPDKNRSYIRKRKPHEQNKAYKEFKKKIEKSKKIW
jgi:hypothetical protein